MVSRAAIVWIIRIVAAGAAVSLLLFVVDKIGDWRESELKTKALEETITVRDDLDEIRDTPVDGTDAARRLREGTF